MCKRYTTELYATDKGELGTRRSLRKHPGPESPRRHVPDLSRQALQSMPCRCEETAILITGLLKLKIQLIYYALELVLAEVQLFAEKLEPLSELDLCPEREVFRDAYSLLDLLHALDVAVVELELSADQEVAECSQTFYLEVAGALA